MKRLSVFVTIIIFSTGVLLAQMGMESYTRYSMGARVLTVYNQDPNFKVFGPNTGNWAPSLTMDYSQLIFERNKFTISLDYGSSFSAVGYKYAKSKDSIAFFKASGVGLFLGLEFSYDIKETDESFYPIRLFVGPEISTLLFQKYGLNKQVSSFDMNSPQGGLGVMSKIDFVFFDGIDFRLSAFYELEWYFEKTELMGVNNKYLYRTHNIGIAVSFENEQYLIF